MSSRVGVRTAIVGIFAVLVTGFTVADVRSQPGRPSGISGRPSGISGISGGINGMPGGIMGRPPGFGPPGGISGIGGIPGPPPIPGGISGISGIGGMPGGIGGNPGGGFGSPRFESVWSCGKCKAELGRGNVKPSYDACPRCGVKFVDGGGGGGFGLMSPPPPANFGAPAPTAPAADPELMPRGSGGNTTPAFTAPPASTSNDASNNSTPTPAEEGPSKTGSLILKIMVGVFGFLFLLGIVGGTILIVSANRSNKPARKARKKALDLDEDN